MADPAQTQAHSPVNVNPANGASPNYFDNMESLATAAHAQAQQQPVSYNAQAPVPQQAAVVDPMFYLSDPPQPAPPQQQQQQFYTHQPQSYAPAPDPTFHSAEQWRQALGGGGVDFQHLLGQVQYAGASSPQQQLQYSLQHQRQLMAQAVQQQQQQQQQQHHQQQQQQQHHHHQQLLQQQQHTVQQQLKQQPIISPPAAQPPQQQQYAQQQPAQLLQAIAPSDSSASTPQTERASTKPPSSAPAPPTPVQAIARNRAEFRPKTAIPQDLTAEEYARECVMAAISNRLPPYQLHPGEYELLRDHINHVQVTTYLNIRNGILRLWQMNQLVSVSREEAAGCAKDYRFFDAAEVAYDWLVRNGFINYGCVEVPVMLPLTNGTKRRKTIVVIGAGMSGLGCARQLEGLIAQFGDKLPQTEPPPQVVVLEARGRIGGRVYSHPLHNQKGSIVPAGKRATVDLGAQVITGFDNGNPLGCLIKGQLALDYHSLKGDSTLYDTDGTVVEKQRDGLVEKLFNDILDRVSIFKQKGALPKTIEGDRELIDGGKDPSGEGGRLISTVEINEVELPPMESPTSSISISGQAPFTAGINKLTGKPTTATGSSASIPAGEQVRALGWQLKEGSTGQESITLQPLGSDIRFPTLGKTMDHVLREYQNLLDLTPLDFRLINWHYANLEYANASNVDALSLSHWDQDDGQEFTGAHTTLPGGYMQVPRGLWLAPRKLDVRMRHVVKRISYDIPGSPDAMCRIECQDGSVLDADHVVVTLPLGVLKAQAVEFDPPLPEWKSGAVERLGYGLLNKVVLVYDEAFWDVDNDMVGLLRDPMGDPTVQESYEAKRGRFYMFWNVYKTSGKPVLVALMAGDAATQTERESDETLIEEATIALQKMYPTKPVPSPSETIITRWRKDPYSRGSYSYVGQEATAEDYDLMAKPVGTSLHFAGEASCKSHPATVHGAYLSGLRAAAEVAESLLGPIHVPSPLIPPKPKVDSTYVSSTTKKRKAEESPIERANELRTTRLEKYEEQLNTVLISTLGERPVKPGRTGANPFLLYQKDHWFLCKANCDNARKKATGNPDAKATRNEVRAALGQMWRDAPEEQKRPYLDQTENNKKNNAASANEFKQRLKEWDDKAAVFKVEWKKENPSVPDPEEAEATRLAELERAELKRSRKLSGYGEVSDEEEY